MAPEGRLPWVDGALGLVGTALRGGVLPGRVLGAGRFGVGRALGVRGGRDVGGEVVGREVGREVGLEVLGVGLEVPGLGRPVLGVGRLGVWVLPPPCGGVVGRA